MSTANSQLVPINVAARWLRVPAGWLRAEAEAGRIPCLRAGKAILCDFAAVEAALLERAQQGKGDAAEQYDRTADVQTEK
jgi:hypothetical protein